MTASPLPRALCLLAAASLASCAPRAASSPAPDARSEYEALPDTTVCVVDRTTQRGLRPLSAKRSERGPVLLVAGEIQPLEQVHPVGLVAGYAGNEPWFRSGEAISVGRERFVPVEGERRIPLDRLHAAGEFRAIPVFADPNDEPPPEAVYVPVRPDCIFQAYVREELMRG